MFECSSGNSYTPSPTYGTIYDFIAGWEDSWPIVASFFPEDPVLITQAIAEGTAVMVSDGWYKPLMSTEIGAASWILECSWTRAVSFGECSTSGLRNEVNAYRSELQGCHAGLLGLLAYCIYHDLHRGSVTFYFDNDAGLDKAAEGNLNVSTKYKHSDLIRAICVITFKLRTKHAVEVSFEKVKGHRADFIPFNKLTRPEQLNDLMDERAKARVDHIFVEQIHPPPMSIKFEGWRCSIDNIKLTSAPADPLLQRIHYAPMRDFLSRPDHTERKMIFRRCSEFGPQNT
jgi:hypothetical protein